jgi:hypothetical protein
MFFSLARLTAHSSSSGHTPPTLSPLSDLSFSALVLLYYLSTTPTLNTFVPPTQRSTFYSHLFVDKMHRVMSRLVRLAADLATLHLLAYSPGSKIGFRATRPCSRNQPLNQGSTTGSNPAVEPVPCTLSASGGTSGCIRQILSRLLQVGLLDLPAGWLIPRMYSHNLAIGSEWLHRRSS